VIVLVTCQRPFVGWPSVSSVVLAVFCVISDVHCGYCYMLIEVCYSVSVCMGVKLGVSHEGKNVH
jgi:hypothetical protein